MRQRRIPHADARVGSKPATSPKVVAIRLLARRDYSRAELTQRLERRGVARADIDSALDDLAAAGYLSDARCADAVVAQKSGRYGKRAIVHALKEKGIGADDAAEAIKPLAEHDEAEDALALWRQRFGVVPANQREKARQVRFLLARGYGLATALRVLRMARAPMTDDS